VTRGDQQTGESRSWKTYLSVEADTNKLKSVSEREVLNASSRVVSAASMRRTKNLKN